MSESDEKFRHSEQLKKLWVNLLGGVAPSLDSGERYCAAASIQGSAYKPGGIAVIGRSLNGWAFDFGKEEIIDASVSELAARIVDVHVCTDDKKMIHPDPNCCGPMHWVEHPYNYRDQVRRNVAIGRFWRAVAEVTKNSWNRIRSTSGKKQ